MTFQTSNRDPEADYDYLFGAVLALLLALRQADLRHFPQPLPVHKCDTHTHTPSASALK